MFYKLPSTKKTEDLAKTYEVRAKKFLRDVEHLSDTPERNEIYEKVKNSHIMAATFHKQLANICQHEGKEGKKVEEYLKAAENYVKMVNINCENDKEESAKYLEEAISCYMLANKLELTQKIYNEYGPTGTKMQLNLKPPRLPLDS
jgi:tetratricopeptide (TPR) repeat protein